jgi:NADH-quinone oxidoreductase subunit L
VLWAVAVIAAFLTATYMFRLLYLTFFGDRKHGAPSTAHAHGDAHGDAHASHLHDAPGPMAIALIVLAIGSILAGFVGVPHVLGGGNQIEAFLEPSFRAIGAVAEAAPAAEAAAEATAEHGGAGLEMGLMLFSTLVALGGIGLATVVFLRNPAIADRMAGQFAGVHRLLLGKYYVDELYDATIVQPIKKVSSGLLWRGVDAGVIDGTVNGVGLVVRGWSAVLRRLQTGSVRAYAMSFFVGVVTIVGYYLWR